jgi:hypothetical protein
MLESLFGHIFDHSHFFSTFPTSFVDADSSSDASINQSAASAPAQHSNASTTAANATLKFTSLKDKNINCELISSSGITCFNHDKEIYKSSTPLPAPPESITGKFRANKWDNIKHTSGGRLVCDLGQRKHMTFSSGYKLEHHFRITHINAQDGGNSFSLDGVDKHKGEDGKVHEKPAEFMEVFNEPIKANGHHQTGHEIQSDATKACRALVPQAYRQGLGWFYDIKKLS